MRELQAEHGFHPLMGCLPALVQIPVFFGLFHVLRSFNRTGTGWGQLGMSPEANAQTADYVFGVADVQSFLSARLFGAPISTAVTTPESVLASFAPFGGIPTVWTVAAVAVPLMVIAGLATHFNARAALARQSPDAASNPQAGLMRKLMLWVFPLGVLVGGPFLMIAILLYWVGNNIWTYGQQHLVFAWLEGEDRARESAAPAAHRSAAPASKPNPGVRPVNSRKKPRRGRK